MDALTQKQIVKILRVLYPVWFLLGIFSILYVPSVLIDFSNPIETANKIRENTLLFRLGIASSLLTQILYIIIPFFLYLLFKNLDRVSSILMFILAITSVPITMYNESKKLMVLDIIDRPNELIGLLNSHNYGLEISTIFWGLWLFPLGWLVYKSEYFPKIIGISLCIGGFGYLINSFLKILFPDFNGLSMILEMMTFGELIFIIWFVAKGVSYSAKKSNKSKI